MRRIKLILFLMPLLCGGCLSLLKLDQLAVVNLIAIDQLPGSKQLTVSLGTYNLAQKEASGQEQQNKNKPTAKEILTAQGQTIGEAMANIKLLSPRQLEFSHNNILIIGRKLAEKSIRPFADYLTRDTTLRSSIRILIADQEARQILEAKNALEKEQPNALEMLLDETTLNNNNYAVPIYHFVRNLKTNLGIAVAPLIKANGPSGLDIGQAAVLQKDKMVGQLNPEQTKIYQWFFGSIQGQTITFPLSSKNATSPMISLIIKNSQTAIKPVKKGPIFTAEIISSASAKLIDASTFRHIRMTPQLLRKMEKSANSYLKKELLNLIKYSQQTLKQDLLGVGEKINNDYPYTWRKLRKNWTNSYAKLKFDISFQLRIKNVGMSKQSL